MADDRVALDGLPRSSLPENTSETKDEELRDSDKNNENGDESVEEPKRPYNTRALLKTAETYELETFEKHAMIIFNHVTVEGYTEPRSGTKKDEEALVDTFGALGFEIGIHTDLKRKELFEELKKFMERDFTDYGCVAVVVLTHGSHNGVLMANDGEYSEIEILDCFRTHDKPTLVTKPRLLLVQACRGLNSLSGIRVHSPDNHIRRDNGIEKEAYYLPVEADILVFHSTYYGNPAVRDEVVGSWFIQTLCEKIKKSSDKLDFMSIAVEVQREIAVEKCYRSYNRALSKYDYNKQMPMMTSSLIRKLYFRKYQDSAARASEGNLEASESQKKIFTDYIPCKCYLKHFEYIKECLIHHVEENPEDEQSVNFLNIANSFKNLEIFDNPKQITLHAICEHLRTKKPDWDTLKYVYLYEGDEYAQLEK